LDIGAHHGFHTLVAARACGPEGRVVAIEPWPKNFLRLSENIRLNRMEDRIQSLEYALGTCDADVSFAAPDCKNSGTGRVTTSLINGFSTVSQTTARNVIEQFGFTKVDAAKIDVEGAELDVLAGWPLETLPRYMLLELLPEGDRNDQVLDWLNQHHYRVETVTGALFKKGGQLPETNLAATRHTLV
jgi:FkbM family methyltransferase